MSHPIGIFYKCMTWHLLAPDAYKMAQMASHGTDIYSESFANPFIYYMDLLIYLLIGLARN